MRFSSAAAATTRGPGRVNTFSSTAIVSTCTCARVSSWATAEAVTDRFGYRSRSGGWATNVSSEYAGHPVVVTALRAPVSLRRSSKYVAVPATYSGSVHTANITDGGFARARRCFSSAVVMVTIDE